MFSAAKEILCCFPHSLPGVGHGPVLEAIWLSQEARCCHASQRMVHRDNGLKVGRMR